MSNPFQPSTHVSNAGLVLLHPYFPMLFENLSITSNKRFNNMEDQMKAMIALHFVSYGENLHNNGDDFEKRKAIHEEDLDATNQNLQFPNDQFLNKILCGLSLDTTIDDSFVLSESQKEIVKGMFEFFMSSSNVFGKTNINGLRESFIWRNGMLTEEENNWRLTVEKKAWDVLLDKVPYSLAIINFPWMQKSLMVEWHY